MKIAHISDIHIRNLKYHDEYRRVFENLYAELEREKPDLIVNTGDTAHTKTQISPEFVEMGSTHLLRSSVIAPYEFILGNHDLNLMNPDRQDAMTPIVESIKSDRIRLHKKSGLGFRRAMGGGLGANFWIFSLADQKNYPTQEQWNRYSNHVNIGLFHGSVAGCVTDLNWRMTDVEHHVEMFDGLDYVLLGDIHKRQSFRGGRVAYPGSLIQQNFGEEIEKGFLVWDIQDKERFETRFIPLKGSRKFYTVKLNPDLSLPDTIVEEGSRVRISPPVSITLAQQKEIERNVRRAYKPHDVITLSATDVGLQRAETKTRTEAVENLRQIQVQERLIREHLESKKLPEVVLQRVLELNRKFHVHVEQQDGTPRNIQWKIDRIAWSNLFNYGEENFLEMAEIPGLTGIFGANGSGKSAFIDSILETCFDSITKNVNKNIHLINDNKESASSTVHVSVNEQRYVIEREINRIKFGQKKYDETREWGRTSVSFSLMDREGGLEPLTGVSRPETERAIRQRLGTYEDFLLTSLSAQANPLDIISCKETKRKEILYKFFDLDIFADKGDLAKKESREFFEKLKRLEDEGLDRIIVGFRNKTFELSDQLRNRRYDLALIEDQIQDGQKDIELLKESRPEIKSFEKRDWRSMIDRCNSENQAQEKILSETRGKAIVVRTELEKISKLETKFDLEGYEEIENELETENRHLSSLINELICRQDVLRDCEMKTQTLGEVPCGTMFPGCKFLQEGFKAKEELPKAKEEVVSIERAVGLKEGHIAKLQVDVDRLNEYRRFVSEKLSLEKDLEYHKVKCDNIQLRINATKETCSKYECELVAYEQAKIDAVESVCIDRAIAGLKEELHDLKGDLRFLQGDIDELNRELGSAEGILDKLTGQMEELQGIRDTCQAYELFIDTMGKDGIALTILVQKLPVLNEQINKILSNAADFGVTVDYDQNEQTVNFYMQYGQYKSRVLELAGGAEKFLGSLAIRAGLLSMSNLPKTNMFIIDEGFGKLDGAKLESVQRMLEYLRTIFDHVLIVSHVDTMKDIVDNIIEITTDAEGYAHVAIGASDAD